MELPGWTPGTKASAWALPALTNIGEFFVSWSVNAKFINVRYKKISSTTTIVYGNLRFFLRAALARQWNLVRPTNVPSETSAGQTCLQKNDLLRL